MECLGVARLHDLQSHLELVLLRRLLGKVFSGVVFVTNIYLCSTVKAKAEELGYLTLTVDSITVGASNG